MISLKETGPATKAGLAHKGMRCRPFGPADDPSGRRSLLGPRVLAARYKREALDGALGLDLIAHHLSPLQLLCRFLGLRYSTDVNGSVVSTSNSVS
jgi:hypothetical protein